MLVLLLLMQDFVADYSFMYSSIHSILNMYNGLRDRGLPLRTKTRKCGLLKSNHLIREIVKIEKYFWNSLHK